MKRTSGSRVALSGAALSLALLSLISQVAAQSLSNLPDASQVSAVSLGGGSSTSSSTSATSSSATTKTNSKSTITSSAKATTTGSAKVSLLENTSTSSGTIFHLSDLPTIAGASNPTQTVPYTANAPFMQKSNMPEGSVFIIVGAILGFFGACVLAWRGMVALSLRRSVKRAALAQHQTFDLKSHAYPGPSAGMYSSGPPGTSASMEKLTAMPKSNKRHSRRPSTSNSALAPTYNPGGARGSTQNLFFSPTAGAGVHSPSTPSLSQRPSSNYLPAGYYMSGSSQPAGGAGSTHINAHASQNPRSSMLNPLTNRLSGIRAENAGYQRAGSFGPSPPESPAMSPSPGHRLRTDSPAGGASSVVGQVGGPTNSGFGLHGQASQSTLNLDVPGGTTQPGGRTPSAYLEDLFENHGTGPRERF